MPPWGRCKGCRAGWPLSPIVPNASQPSRSPGARPQAVAPAPAPEAVPAGAGAERLATRPPGAAPNRPRGRRCSACRSSWVTGRCSVSCRALRPGPPRRRCSGRSRDRKAPAGAPGRLRGSVPAEAAPGAAGGAGGRRGAGRRQPGGRAQIAYAQAINQHAPALAGAHRPPGRRDRRCQVYGLIVERDTKKGQLQEWTTILQGHGTIPGKTVDERQDGRATSPPRSSASTARSRSSSPPSAWRTRRSWPSGSSASSLSCSVARARQIALVILDQNQTDVLRESNRYVVSQSTATGAPPRRWTACVRPTGAGPLWPKGAPWLSASRG